MLLSICVVELNSTVNLNRRFMFRLYVWSGTTRNYKVPFCICHASSPPPFQGKRSYTVPFKVVSERALV